MSTIFSSDKHYKNIANKIRSVTQTTSTYLPSELPNNIKTLNNYTNPFTSVSNGIIYNTNSISFIGNKKYPGYYAGKDLLKINISDLTNIPDYAFIGCINGSNIKLSDSLISIGNHSFERANIYGITLPNSIETIGDYAFANSNLGNISLPQNLISIGEYAFMYSGLNNVTIPKNVTTIKQRAFIWSVNTLTFEECPVTIEDHAFWNCNGLKTVTFPASLVSLKGSAFGACYGLQTVTFKGKPTSISATTFSQCDALTTINVPWSEGEVAGVPWGAPDATINYNYSS